MKFPQVSSLISFLSVIFSQTPEKWVSPRIFLPKIKQNRFVMKQMHINLKAWGIGLLFAAAMTACDNEIPEYRQPVQAVKTQIIDKTQIKAAAVKKAAENKSEKDDAPKKEKKKKTVVRTTVKFWYQPPFPWSGVIFFIIHYRFHLMKYFFS